MVTRRTHIGLIRLHPAHLLKLHRKKPKTLDAPTIESGRDEPLLKLNLLHERSDVGKRRPQLPQTRSLDPTITIDVIMRTGSDVRVRFSLPLGRPLI
jgi:hypothetical protein